jgi:hypothetical protein
MIRTEDIKIEDFKKNISIENLNNFIKNNILFKNLHSREFNDIIFNKYIELFIHNENIDNTYFMQLENYINYFDENSLETIDNINEIDCSFYANNKIKEYLFMVNFLSDFYKSKYKQKKEYNINVVDTKTINIKLKQIYQGDTDNIVSVFSLNNIEYVPIELLFNDDDMTIKSITIIDTSFNIDKKEEYKANFDKLFNKINKININDLNKNIDYYYCVLQSYKYKYYDILLNYNIIQLYYVYIKINGGNENTNIIKYQEIFKLLEHFNIVLLHNEIKFNQLNAIMNTVDKLDSKAESEKIEDAKYSMNKLKEINYNLLQNEDYIKNNYKKIEVTQKDINTNTGKIIVISVLLALTFITYAISINYYSLDTSKILSVIIISVIVIVILVNNYIIKNKTYENFELAIETTTIDDDLINILESGSSISNYASLQEKMAELEENKNLIFDTQYVPLDNSSYTDTIDIIDTENNPDYVTGNQLQYEKIQNAYNELRTTDSENTTLNNNITNLNHELGELNQQYTTLKEKEDELIEIKNGMDEQLRIAKNKATAAETQIYEKGTTIIELDKILDEYQNMKENLDALILQKANIKVLKSEKIGEINEFNIKLLKDVATELEKSNNNEAKIKRLDLVLSYLIFNIDDLNKEKERFETQTILEQGLITQLNMDILVQTARNAVVVNKVSEQMIRIINLEQLITNEDMAVQKLAKKIIELENKNETRARESQRIAITAVKEAEIAFGILNQKIAQIKIEIANKPKPIKYKLKLDLNFDIVAGQESSSSKRNNFKNEILLELSKLLVIPLNRFRIDNIYNVDVDDDKSIYIDLVFYPSRTYDNRDLSNKELISILNGIFTGDAVNNKLLNTKYLKFTMEISKLDDSDNVVEDSVKSLKTAKYLNTDNIISKIKNIFDKNSTIINNLETIINQLENEKRNPNTYYNEINPNLNIEVKKYSEKNLRINNDENILNSKTDILIHDYINYHYIYKYLSYITLLFALVFLSYSYLNNYIFVIYILTLIIFLVILFNLYIDIYKNVRRKSKKQYWKKPNKI